MQRKSRFFKKGLLLIFLFIGFYMLLSGCASSKLKKVEDSYEQGFYHDVINSKAGCSDSSPKCFRIKLIKADSYYQLNDISSALLYADEAVDRISNRISMEDINKLYILRTRLLSQKLSLIDDQARRIEISKKLESDILIAFQTNERLPTLNSYHQQREQLLFLWAEVLLEKMEWVSSGALTNTYQDFMEVVNKFDESLSKNGYKQYYLWQGEFKYLQPEIKKWLFIGDGTGEREKIIVRLKDLYRQGVTLRNLPVYLTTEGRKIDQLINAIDGYMKQFVI
jgi:hypothetical protein